MSLLGKYTDNLIEDNELEQENDEFTTPVVLKNDEELSLKKSILISAILHPVAIGTWALIVFILALLGINFVKFDKPTPKVNDIEFVLVENEDTPINKKTPYRADRNSRAGGHHNPKLPVSMPSPAPGAPKQVAKAIPNSKPAQNPLQKIVKQVTSHTQGSAAPSKKVTHEQPAPGPKRPQMAKPAPPTARPSIKPPSTPRPSVRPSSPFTVPVPKGGTGTGRYTTGPISGSGSSSRGGGGGGSSASTGRGYGPVPSLAPTGGGSGNRLAKGNGGGGGTGGYGNPGPGNPNGRPGIDAIREPDFGPYIAELQRRIKMNWDPPKGDESKRVVLLFKIAKDGRLLECRVLKTSGSPNADKAAINAVHATAPFKPLPAEYRNQNVDIHFTFDYIGFGAKY